MPVEPYPTKVVDGQEYWVVETLVPKESDPERGAYIFFAKPLQGITGMSGLIKGDDGKSPIIDPNPDVTWLEPDDPTEDSYTFVEITPPSGGEPGVYRAVIVQHKPEKGEDGDTVLDPGDFDGGQAGDVITLNNNEDGFELTTPKVGGMHWPASLNNATNVSQSTFQIGTIAVSAGTYRNPWRPDPEAAVTVTGSSTDIAVDIVARLNAPDGPVVGRGRSVAGVQTQRVVLQSGPPAGTSVADSTYYVAANAGATVYLMAEKVSGAATFSTTQPHFGMKASPLP